MIERSGISFKDLCFWMFFTMALKKLAILIEG